MPWYQFCSIVVTKRLRATGVEAKKCHIFSHEEEESRNYIYHQPLHAQIQTQIYRICKSGGDGKPCDAGRESRFLSSEF